MPYGGPPAIPFLCLLLAFSTGVVAVGPFTIAARHEVYLNSTPVYRQVVNHLSSYALPDVPTHNIDLVGFTPFCEGFNRTPPQTTIAKECLRWEEHELDMLLMHIDLIAVGMKKTLAEGFYKEIRCLSRAHTSAIPGQHAWQVCFQHDYSEVVGSLLAKYIEQDFDMKPHGAEEEGLSITSRFLFGSWGRVSSRNRGSFLLHAFGSGARFRLYGNPTEMRRQTSCCRRCTKSHYFVNIEVNQCLKNPFGKHCCHKACKSLGRLKAGMSSSVSHCCRRCRPLQCAR